MLPRTGLLALCTGGGFPPGYSAVLLCLCQKRAVQFLRGSYKGPLRQLRRSVGMGGTASPRLWNISYDLVIAATTRVAGSPSPTYVDDLASLLSGTSQTLRVTFLLQWASRALGLYNATHDCQSPYIPEPSAPPYVRLRHSYWWTYARTRMALKLLTLRLTLSKSYLHEDVDRTHWRPPRFGTDPAGANSGLH